MNKNKFYYLSFLFILILFVFLISDNIKVFYLSADDSLENEDFKVTFDKDTSFFNIYSKKYKVYLLFPSKPLTSTIYIKYDNQLIIPQKTSALKRELFLKNNTLVFNFELSYLNLIESIRFIETEDKNICLNIEFEIINKDKRGHYINLGVLIDTYLGETYLIPFRVSTIGLLDKAKIYEKTNIPDMVYSLDNPKDPIYGLIFYFRKAGFSLPEKVILASYSDIQDNLFNSKNIVNLSFDSKYKKGDAAIGVVFTEKYLEKDQSSKYNMLIGFYPLLKTEENKTEQIDKSSEYLEKYVQEQIEKLNKKLNYLKDLLSEIYKKIDDIKILDKIIIKLQEIYNLILYLEQNYQNITLDEFNKKVKDIELMIEEIQKTILQQ